MNRDIVWQESEAEDHWYAMGLLDDQPIVQVLAIAEAYSVLLMVGPDSIDHELMKQALEELLAETFW